jgi:hypothetical protein
LTAIYLAMGLVFSLNTLPQGWECPVPGTGATFQYSGGDAPHPECVSLVTIGDTLTWVALATPMWGVFVGGKALWPD